jgi:hypothetical protein
MTASSLPGKTPSPAQIIEALLQRLHDIDHLRGPRSKCGMCREEERRAGVAP